MKEKKNKIGTPRQSKSPYGLSVAKLEALNTEYAQARAVYDRSKRKYLELKRTEESLEGAKKDKKKLMRLQVDLGPLGKRQILAGISQHYQSEGLVGKNIIVVANLKPAKLMGEESQGMLLAASDETDSILSLLHPDKEIPPGSRVR